MKQSQFFNRFFLLVHTLNSVSRSIIATIFPKDGCRLTMTPRKHST